MKKELLLSLGILLISIAVSAQSYNFSIQIEPFTISELGGVQSYAYGQHDDKWLIVGGRLDGLHRRQPWAAFDLAGHNNQLIVVDPINAEKWSIPLAELPVGMQEQLSSTNMEFHQAGDYLYCIGGYGYSATIGDHTTYDKMVAINVPEVINAIINNTNISPYFRQITDEEFQVTGGKLKKINNVYHLLGGHKFLGRYNPMGPNHGPGFIQEYTNSIRRFTIEDDGNTININHLPSYTDSINLHRRDYNAEHQIMPNQEEGITMFSGVFQYDTDLPFLNCVNVDANSYSVNNDFQQKFNHYHCPSLPMYSEQDNLMNTIFFGGIAQYYELGGLLVQDDNVPFVRTIAKVSRDENGNMTEHKLPIEMPDLLGAGGEFIPNLILPHYSNKVFNFDELPSDTTLLGYIFGGISSDAENIFFINDGTQSNASSTLFKVFITKELSTAVDKIEQSSLGGLNLAIYPNPNKNTFFAKYTLAKNTTVHFSIVDTKGVIVHKKRIDNQQAGENTVEFNIDDLKMKGVYFLKLRTNETETMEKFLIQE